MVRVKTRIVSGPGIHIWATSLVEPTLLRPEFCLGRSALNLPVDITERRRIDKRGRRWMFRGTIQPSLDQDSGGTRTKYWQDWMNMDVGGDYNLETSKGTLTIYGIVPIRVVRHPRIQLPGVDSPVTLWTAYSSLEQMNITMGTAESAFKAAIRFCGSIEGLPQSEESYRCIIAEEPPAE